MVLLGIYCTQQLIRDFQLGESDNMVDTVALKKRLCFQCPLSFLKNGMNHYIPFRSIPFRSVPLYRMYVLHENYALSPTHSLALCESVCAVSEVSVPSLHANSKYTAVRANHRTLFMSNGTEQTFCNRTEWLFHFNNIATE